LGKYWIFILGFFVSLIVAPFVIKLATKLKCGQNILSYVDKHKNKQGTPTMGGVIFLLSLLVCFLVIFNKNSRLSAIVVLVTFSYGLLGFLDDFLKIKLKHNEGLKAYQKFIGQFGIAIIIALFVYYTSMVSDTIILPFGLKNLNLGWGIIPFVIVFFVAVTNSVNLTDGLDGLAGSVSLVNVLGVALVLTTVITRIELPAPMEEYQNLVLLCFALCGGLLGYLVYNFNPASIFMGDTGSMFIGYMLAAISVYGAVKTAATVALIVPAIALGLPIMDTAFAIMRRYSNGRPIFQPDKGHLHHRLLAMGMNQKQAVLLMYGISAVLGIAAVLWAEFDGFYAALIIAVIITAVAVGAKKIGILNDR